MNSSVRYSSMNDAIYYDKYNAGPFFKIHCQNTRISAAVADGQGQETVKPLCN